MSSSPTVEDKLLDPLKNLSETESELEFEDDDSVKSVTTAVVVANNNANGKVNNGHNNNNNVTTNGQMVNKGATNGLLTITNNAAARVSRSSIVASISR